MWHSLKSDMLFMSKAVVFCLLPKSLGNMVKIWNKTITATEKSGANVVKRATSTKTTGDFIWYKIAHTISSQKNKTNLGTA